VRALSLRVGGVFLESGDAIDSSATMIQDVAITFKAKNFSNAIALEYSVQENNPYIGYAKIMAIYFIQHVKDQNEMSNMPGRFNHRQPDL
jgi:hypothetical protein